MACFRRNYEVKPFFFYQIQLERIPLSSEWYVGVSSLWKATETWQWRISTKCEEGSMIQRWNFPLGANSFEGPFVNAFVFHCESLCFHFPVRDLGVSIMWHVGHYSGMVWGMIPFLEKKNCPKICSLGRLFSHLGTVEVTDVRWLHLLPWLPICVALALLRVVAVLV